MLALHADAYTVESSAMGAALLEDNGRTAARDAVRAIEMRTSAEIVVALRRRSGSWLGPEIGAGAALALAVLCALVYLPQEVETLFIPIHVIVAFIAGALACRAWPVLQRLLSSPAAKRARVREAARVLFVDKGVSRTRGRTGLLVYASVVERMVEIVFDVGVERAAIPPATIEGVQRALETALAADDVPAFRAALERLAPILGDALPCQPDDVNELPDEAA
jgi:putative membrane protein